MYNPNGKLSNPWKVTKLLLVKVSLFICWSLKGKVKIAFDIHNNLQVISERSTYHLWFDKYHQFTYYLRIQNCFYIQINSYKMVVNFFHISHNLTWYSALSISLPKYTQFVNCSTCELTRQYRYRISSYDCRGNYSFLNSSSEETIQVFISLK